jgi:hypothetical protein
MSAQTIEFKILSEGGLGLHGTHRKAHCAIEETQAHKVTAHKSHQP